MRRQFLSLTDMADGLIFASVFLYVVSLVFPPFCLYRLSCDSWPSWSILLLGWMGLPLGGWSNLIWLANPILFIAWAKQLRSHRSSESRQRRNAAILSYIALTLALSFLLAKTVVANEGGVPQAIESYDWGYWIWVSGIACCAAGTTINLCRDRVR